MNKTAEELKVQLKALEQSNAKELKAWQAQMEEVRHPKPTNTFGIVKQHISHCKTDHISQCKPSFDTDWSNRWTYHKYSPRLDSVRASKGSESRVRLPESELEQSNAKELKAWQAQMEEV